MPNESSREFTMGPVESIDPIEEEKALTLRKQTIMGQGPAPAPATALDPGLRVGGRYEIEKAVGHGAFGSVYRATDVEVPGHVVALKILHHRANSDAARDTALRELRLIASVFHPSVVSFKDSGWHEGRLWFVMPWYQGETLQARVERSGALSRAEAFRLFVPLARGLAAMHASKVRHQDVKPDNIFLARVLGINQSADSGDVLPVLLDLGVAALDAEYLMGGTVEYFAPEAAALAATFQGHPPTFKADVFSLALSLRNALEPSTAETLTGESAPFMKHRADQLVSLPSARELKYLHPHFRRWLSLDPEVRPTADAFADELSVLVAPEAARERRRNTRRVLVPAAAIVLGLVAMLYALTKKNEAAESLLRARAAQMASDHDRRELENARAALIQQQLQERLERTQAQESISESTIVQLQGQITSQNLSNSQLVQRLADATGRNDSLRGMLGAARTDLTTANATLVARQADLDQTRSDLATRTRERDEVRGELSTRTAERDQVRSELAQRTTERDQVRTDLNARTTERDQLTASLAQAQNQLVASHAETAARERERDQARGDLEAANAARAQLSTRVEQLSTHLEQLQRASAVAHTAPSSPSTGGTAAPSTEEPAAPTPPAHAAEHDS